MTLNVTNGRVDGTHQRHIDRGAVERAAADLLRALGAGVDAEALGETPRRVADAYAELLTPQPFRATTFPHNDG
jgi:GTP cyclohydrolase IA